MNPGARQLLLGSSQRWRSTLPAIRAFVTANYNQPNPHNQAVMGAPPTITASTTQPAGLTQERRWTNTGVPEVSFLGGGNSPFGAATFRRFPSATVFSSGATNLGNGIQAVTWRAAASFTASKVAWRILGSTVGYRFIVGTQYVSLTPSSTATTSGTNYFQLDFGSSATRTIAIESEQATGFDGIGVAVGDTMQAIAQAAPKRFIAAGDSFCEATGATVKADGLAVYAADMLGFQDAWQSGVGGTGYVNTVTGTKFNLGQRLFDVNLTGPWDIIVVPMGINDIGLSTTAITVEANYCLTSLRRANPGAQIFVVGPWDVNAPAAPVANYAATKLAIQQAIPAGSGIFFLDAEGVSFTKFDATHPDTAGHATLGAWLALQIKTLLGA